MGMLAGALLAREEAQRCKTSWRGYYVGTAAWGIDKAGQEQAFLAGNTKFSCDDPKDCGEIKNMRAARRRGVLLKRFFIIGTPQRDQGSGVLSGTLQPCELCRAWMRSQAYRDVVVQADTLIITFNPHTHWCQHFTVLELMRMHGERW